jgi:hypothetical protein
MSALSKLAKILEGGHDMREYFIKAHDELIARYLEDHPEANEDEAVNVTADRAYDRMCDNLADMAGDATARQEDIANGHMQARRAQREREEARDADMADAAKQRAKDAGNWPPKKKGPV